MPLIETNGVAEMVMGMASTAGLAPASVAAANLPATAAVLVMAAVLIGFALRSLWAQRLKERYALVFLLIALPFLALAAWPDAIATLAAWVGIDYRTFALLVVTTFFIVLHIKLLSIISVQERRITTLAQHVAMIEMREPGTQATTRAEGKDEGDGRAADAAR